MAIPGERFVLDLSDDEQDVQPPTVAGGLMIGEIKERTPKAPSAPTLKSTTTGFPVSKNRLGGSAFKQRRNDALPSRFASRNQITTQPRATSQVESMQDEEKRIIDEENKQRIAAMSETEIEQEKAELMANLSPSLIERLLRRANIDDEVAAAPTNKTELKRDTAEAKETKKTGKSVSFGMPDIKQTETVPETTDFEDRPPAIHPPDLRPASEFPSGPIHFPTPPPRQTPMPNLDPSSPSFYDDLQAHYFPDTPHDSSALSWLKPLDKDTDAIQNGPENLSAYHPASSTTQIVPSAIRFSFRGEMLPPSKALDLPTSLGLHHHADDPEAAGYTISELSILSRSTVAAQRCVAWQVLGRILFRLGSGEFGADGSDLVDGLWKVVELEGVVSRMLEEAEGGPQHAESESEGTNAGVKSNIGRHASAKAWAVEGIWLWQKGGGKRGIAMNDIKQGFGGAWRFVLKFEDSVPSHTYEDNFLKMSSADRPEILLLSLCDYGFLNESYASLFKQLHDSAHIERTETADAAIRYLTEKNPKAIIITDEGLTLNENTQVLEKVVEYVRNGGRAIIGLLFPNCAQWDDIGDLFNRAFQLPWKSANYMRETFEVNPSCTLPDSVSVSSLPKSYMAKALHIKNARPHEKILVPENEFDEEDYEDRPIPERGLTPAYLEQTQAMVTGAKVGDGYVAYCGDVNGEDGSDKVILALCGLR
ncbi:transcription factor Rba50, putative [Talaromyces stipitatus ATCC 10500]|uniref:Transcription factor Rba50, putative n=1 Tax=Talaromyces stipitatus (strain ATCC 10500 / CBS 375.48 / QM 6759 / NRRL 1006) TaxID=441959 RepID=B8MNH4_TALSN|nr:transcription factor Rba50, putative [Talaromyces stipitatus ATCC 10500]EED14063.1 transcription factor Rba50, putative [Talaromyces stipitatus ATCC 10500]